MNDPSKGTEIAEWHSGTGKILRVGDVVNEGARLWRIRRIIERPSGHVDVTVVAHRKVTKARDAGTRTFLAEDLSLNRAKTAQARAVDQAEAEAQAVIKAARKRAS